MAEFSEVMRQARRMCEADESWCSKCDVHENRCCVYSFLPKEYDTQKLQEFERIVMQWAAEHPEPRYPTWAEWQKANFPDATLEICPNHFMEKKPLGTCAIPCAKCMSTPIPADIAAKLGIKPIGET